LLLSAPTASIILLFTAREARKLFYSLIFNSKLCAAYDK